MDLYRRGQTPGQVTDGEKAQIGPDSLHSGGAARLCQRRDGLQRLGSPRLRPVRAGVHVPHQAGDVDRTRARRVSGGDAHRLPHLSERGVHLVADRRGVCPARPGALQCSDQRRTAVVQRRRPWHPAIRVREDRGGAVHGADARAPDAPHRRALVTRCCPSASSSAR